MTAFGVATGPVPIDGNGEFDGVMLASFSKPRIEGTFKGDRLRAWNVVWGRAVADVVIENSYAVVSNAVVTSGGSEIRADGQFSLGYPRKDQGEEIDARVRLDPAAAPGSPSRLRARRLSDGGHGLGRLPRLRTVRASVRVRQDGDRRGDGLRRNVRARHASLRFEGNGVRLDSLDIRKSSGTVTGAAFVELDGRLLLQRRRHADSRRVARPRGVPAGASFGSAAVQRKRRRHVRQPALRREAEGGRPVRGR